MMDGAQTSSARDNILAEGRELFSKKGFSAVGLAEILKNAGVPKGSFYHYFCSKDEFGSALLESYFEDYYVQMDKAFSRKGLRADEKLILYFSEWRESQTTNECQGRCLVVKLGAEVADLSDAMRCTLHSGTDGILKRLAELLRSGAQEGSISLRETEQEVALTLYQLWVGASILAKISLQTSPFDAAMKTTRAILGRAG